MQNRWKLKPLPNTETVHKFAEEIQTPEIVSTILIQRGIDTFEKARYFFKPQLTDLYDPFLMKDMDKAVLRVLKAIEKGENILVYGDYDVDGTTSVALMYTFLKELYSQVSFYIPDRHNEGYGLSEKGVQFASDNDFQLIITLDCGIKAIENIELAKKLGIDVIVCDHHLPEEELPCAVAILDPQRPDCQYPFKFLSGCGVGFKLAQAIAQKTDYEENTIFKYLDLVVVSIAADIVPIIDENRVLAKFGIEILRNQPRAGLEVMISERMENLTISHIVFGIAPKINAAGRIDHASEAVELLIAESAPEARKIIKKINEFNTERRDLDAHTTEEALAQIASTKQENNASSIVYNENWHKGVIGIVASRLIDKYYKPTLVFTKGSDDLWVASARSVKNFDVYKALEECAPLLERFGGHMYAAGLSIKEENFAQFRMQFEDAVKNNISLAQQTPEIEIDVTARLSEITDKVYKRVGQMEPFGPKNMKPVFLSKNLLYGGKHKIIGKTKEHLQFAVFETESKEFKQVTGFNFAEHLKKIKKYPFDLVYTLDENHWQGRVYYKLMAKDIRFYED